MATQSPFLLLENLARSMATRFPPPAWLVDEAQRRVVLLLNHVLLQETAATSRLVRQKGRVVSVQWRELSIRLMVTPAGLLDLADAALAADLSLALTDASPWAMAQSMLRGDKPALRIEGDVQLAAEVNWLTDNLRWDLEEDLSRLVGDVTAYRIGQVARQAVQAMRHFQDSARSRAGPAGAAAA